eukprot:TRINITY_DN6477_c0_g1_i1.p2 TRINITY_DN6477_c0_g1~~TRINITY_DN6477_c0_g1_i1.p2  ORF type:complete len:303 (-),score=25.10 TRINITY_DN6477_c0_g1_i1:493-1401(-)
MFHLFVMLTQAWFIVSGLNIQSNSQVYQFTHGQFECVVLSDGATYTPLTDWYPSYPKEESEQLANEFSYNDGNVLVSFNALLCETGNWLVLIDSGALTRFGGGDTGKIFESLQDVGVDPNSIRDIILSHGHVDHFSGLFSDDQEVLFPNAQVWIPQADYDYYTNQSNADAGYFDDFNFVFSGLQAAGVPVRKFSAGPLFEGFEAIDASGHSPGHVLLKVTSDNETLYYCGDIIFNEVNVAYPSRIIGYDMDPVKATQFRMEFLKLVAEENALVSGYHLTFPGLGFIQPDGDSYRWVPQQWEF